MSPKLKNSLISLLTLFLIAIGFQNMSWLDVQSDVHDPDAKYIPVNLQSANSAQDVGEQVLKHNLAPLEQALRDRLDTWTHNNINFSAGGDEHNLAAEYSSETISAEGEKSSWIVGVTSPTNYRFAYRGEVDLTCDVSVIDQSYKVSVKRSISSTSDIRLVHDSKLQDSSLKMQISW